MRPHGNIKLMQEQVQKKSMDTKGIHAYKNQNYRRNYARLMRAFAFTFAFGEVKDL